MLTFLVEMLMGKYHKKCIFETALFAFLSSKNVLIGSELIQTGPYCWGGAHRQIWILIKTMVKLISMHVVGYHILVRYQLKPQK